MSGEDYKRKKKVKNGRKHKRKWIHFRTIFTKIVLTIVLVISGCFIIRTIAQMHFSEVDIVLDAGHGGNDPGAIEGDVIEKEITLDLAERTKELLEESGYKVGMTRKEDSYVGLGERVEFANSRRAKVFVSIHCNASENHKGNGIETFYNEEKGLKNEKLAEMIHKSVVEKTNANDRGTKIADFTVIVRSNMPATLIEVGFLTDEVEKKMLQDKDYQEKLAKGISEGIKKYLQSLD